MPYIGHMHRRRTSDAALPDPHAVIQHAALRAGNEIDTLVGDFLAQIREIPPYSDGAVPEESLREMAELSIGLLLQTITREPGAREALEQLALELGRSRADQGVPLGDLLKAVRLDFRVIWSSLVQRLDDDGEASALLLGGTEVWDAVESYSERVLLAYQQRITESARELEVEQRRWFDRLLQSGGARSDLVARTSQLLRIQADRECTVYVGVRPESGLGAYRDRLRAAGGQGYLHDFGEFEILLCQMGPKRELPEAEGVRGIRIGPVEGLRGVPHAVQLGLAGLDAVGTPQSCLGTAELWPRLAVARIGEFMPDLIREVLSGLWAIDAVERERLIRTVEVYLETAGIQQTADRLFYHRNTITNHLTRFAELTGFDVTDARHTTRVELAVCALRAEAQAGHATERGQTP
ncbi:helix-turn-helix domain-containing protein [Streptomyces sp. NPDC052042]|uniref:helix-turn-helix domain-containing protein n=1 Tax=Streptomyces sp. NPDC052042 TaxID=3365683 RepID=UPI0037D030CE